MAAPAHLPFNIQVNKAPESAIKNRYELRISRLYLHHSANNVPENTNLTIVRPENGWFGYTVANNWAIHNGPDPNMDAIVARAQGLHMQTGALWYSSFNIIFDTDWLKGSTLQVMGAGVQNGDQWGIVSGTGHFTMAQGFINKKLYAEVATGNIIELDIYATFRPSKSNLIKDGPKGGSGGEEHEPAEVPYRLEIIKIRENVAINSIEFTYFDQYGIKYTEGPWGGDAPYTDTVKLEATEFIKEVSGTVGNINGSDVVTSLKFVTNLHTYGPYGKATGTPFSLPEKKDGSVVGFIARTGDYVNAIGVVMRP